MNPMMMLQPGDRVRVAGEPHMPGQTTGTVEIVHPGPAYGIRFDGDDEAHKWYVGDELTPEDDDEGNDGEGQPHKQDMAMDARALIADAFGDWGRLAADDTRYAVLGAGCDVERWRRERGLSPRSVIAVTPNNADRALRGLSCPLEFVVLPSWSQSSQRVRDAVCKDIALIQATAGRR